MKNVTNGGLLGKTNRPGIPSLALEPYLVAQGHNLTQSELLLATTAPSNVYKPDQAKEFYSSDSCPTTLFELMNSTSHTAHVLRDGTINKRTVTTCTLSVTPLNPPNGGVCPTIVSSTNVCPCGAVCSICTYIVEKSFAATPAQANSFCNGETDLGVLCTDLQTTYSVSSCLYSKRKTNTRLSLLDKLRGLIQ